MNTDLPKDEPNYKALYTELRGEVLEKVGPTLKLRAGIASDVLSAHQNRGNGASRWMREDDNEFRHDLVEAFRALSTLYEKLSSIEVFPELPGGDVKNAAGEAEGSGAWRTIDSAPRDGTVIDVWCPAIGRCADVQWEPLVGDFCRSITMEGEPGWQHWPNSPPTHWQPLPPPPSNNPKGEG